MPRWECGAVRGTLQSTEGCFAAPLACRISLSCSEGRGCRSRALCFLGVLQPLHRKLLHSALFNPRTKVPPSYPKPVGQVLTR